MTSRANLSGATETVRLLNAGKTWRKIGNTSSALSAVLLMVAVACDGYVALVAAILGLVLALAWYPCERIHDAHVREACRWLYGSES